METIIKPSVLTLDTRGQQIAQETFKTVTPTLLQDCAGESQPVCCYFGWFAVSQLCSGGVFSDQTSVWFISDETEAEPEAPLVERTDRNPRHVFVSKTVRTSRRSPVMLSRFGFTKHVTAQCLHAVWLLRQCRAVHEASAVWQSATGSLWSL